MIFVDRVSRGTSTSAFHRTVRGRLRQSFVNGTTLFYRLPHPLFFEEWSDSDTFTRHMTFEHVQQWKEAHGHCVNGDLEITVWENRS